MYDLENSKENSKSISPNVKKAIEMRTWEINFSEIILGDLVGQGKKKKKFFSVEIFFFIV
jgi:hypothetical protein